MVWIGARAGAKKRVGMECAVGHKLCAVKLWGQGESLGRGAFVVEMDELLIVGGADDDGALVVVKHESGMCDQGLKAGAGWQGGAGFQAAEDDDGVSGVEAKSCEGVFGAGCILDPYAAEIELISCQVDEFDEFVVMRVAYAVVVGVAGRTSGDIDEKLVEDEIARGGRASVGAGGGRRVGRFAG